MPSKRKPPRTKYIKGTPFLVSEDGVLFRENDDGDWKQIMGGYRDSDGRWATHLRWGPKGAKHNRYVATNRIVLETFVGPRPHAHETKWLDGDKLNNCLSNLQWVPIRREPIRGEDSTQALLTEAQVLEARARAANGEMVEHYAHEYGVGAPYLRSVVNGAKWKHLPGALKRKPGPKPWPLELKKPRKSRARPKSQHKKPGPKGPRRNKHHGSTLDSFLKEEGIGQPTKGKKASAHKKKPAKR